MTTSNKPVLNRNQLHEVLWNLTSKHLGIDRAQIRADQRLVHDLGADSLGVVELSMELEEELGITIPEEILENRDLTLGDLEQALAKELQEGAQEHGSA